MCKAQFLLENAILRVEVDPTRPLVRHYHHLVSGQHFAGAGEEGILRLNGQAAPWEAWALSARCAEGKASYHMRLKGTPLELRWELTLEGNALVYRLEAVHDPQGEFTRLDWQDLPLLVCRGPGYSYWRMSTGAPDPQTGHKMWAQDHLGTLAGAAAEETPQPVIYGALWNGALCTFADSNYPLFPLTHQQRGGGSYAIGLNTYQYRVRQQTLPLLEARVVFLGDLNGDGRADLSDYRLWVNRARPKGDPLYADAIAYKIFMHYGPLGTATDLAQAEQIISAINRVTDGLPQVIYLVGQQEGGHDGAYPTLEGFNPHIGTPEQLLTLSQTCPREYNTLLSYHANIDDAYPHSRDWDEAYVVAGQGGDQLVVPGSVCHTRDAETGAVFRRLQRFMDCFPLARTLHFDNLRLTNTLNRPGWEEFGVLEELVCGVMPVVDWLRQRGITVTTEGYNGLPIDPALIVSGFWHHDPPDRMRQILHQRIYGGGRGDHLGRATTADYGLGNAIHIDLTYKRMPPEDLPEAVRREHFSWLPTATLTWCLESQWQQITDCIYLGVLLHHFYNERELLAWDEVGEGWRITYAGRVVAEVCISGPDALRVCQGAVVVAEGEDRFIPREGAVYAYSKGGSEKAWVLPEELRGRPLRLCTLGREGRGPAPAYRLEGEAIHLRLEAGVPVKLEAAG